MVGAARLVFLASAMLLALVVAPAAGADLADEQALAEKYAPIVRVVEQEDVCGYGEPFVPTDIDLLLGEETVALRGPWNVTDLVEIAPTADDLVNRFEYHLDFPGNALDPGCDYNRWAQRLTQEQRARRLRARRRRGGVSGKARSPVLVLLPVQRLQQHARGRLGDDPARLRRSRRARGARRPAGRGRIQLARGSRARNLGRRQARGGRRASRRVPGSRLPCQQVLGRALARELGRGRRWLRRHARSAPRALPACRDDPE